VKDGWRYKVGTKQDDRFYQFITRNFSPKEITTRGFFVQAGSVSDNGDLTNGIIYCR
jgi:hypothetical protein